jgi:hypothetical protein
VKLAHGQLETLEPDIDAKPALDVLSTPVTQSPTPVEKRNWPAIKAYAIEHGIRAAGRHFGIPPGTITCRSTKEQWLANPGTFGPPEVNDAQSVAADSQSVGPITEEGKTSKPRALGGVRPSESGDQFLSRLQRRLSKTLDRLDHIPTNDKNVHLIAAALEKLERAGRVPFRYGPQPSGAGSSDAQSPRRRLNVQAHNARTRGLPAPIDVEAEVLPAPVETEDEESDPS